jgi:hypothetical protein
MGGCLLRTLAGVLLGAVLIIYAMIYLEFSRVPVSYVYNSENPRSLFYKQREEELLKFIENNLIGENGEIKTNSGITRDGGESLSESPGLLMTYCIIADKKELFDRQLSFLRNKLLVNGRYLKWRTGEPPATCNAAIDDLRIVRALLDAHAKWGAAEYSDTADVLQNGLLEKMTYEGNLCELYDWRLDKRRNMIPLCYLDLYTMDRLRFFDESWLKVWDRGLKVIGNGRYSPVSPLFYKYYDYDGYTYSPDEEYIKGGASCLTYSIYTAIHLAEVNEDTSFFAAWLKEEMSEGRLYAWYDPITLKPANKIESTAVYALAAVYSK